MFKDIILGLHFDIFLAIKIYLHGGLSPSYCLQLHLLNNKLEKSRAKEIYGRILQNMKSTAGASETEKTETEYITNSRRKLQLLIG